jgi:hypothetical protein
MPIYYPIEPYPSDGECTNCWTSPPEGERLVWLHSQGFWACETCAEDAMLHEQSERTCPNLYNEVLECKSVKEVQAVMQDHSCPMCETEMERAA